MARRDGKDRGLLQRQGHPDWGIPWTCPYGHDHREKIGPKSLAREVYHRRKVAVKTENFCLTQAREHQHRVQPTLFRNAARRYLAWSAEHRPRSYTFRATALKHLVAAFGATPLAAVTRDAVEHYQRERHPCHAAPGGGRRVNRCAPDLGRGTRWTPRWACAPTCGSYVPCG